MCVQRERKSGAKARASVRRYDGDLPMGEVCIDLRGPFPESRTRGDKFQPGGVVYIVEMLKPQVEGSLDRYTERLHSI